MRTKRWPDWFTGIVLVAFIVSVSALVLGLMLASDRATDIERARHDRANWRVATDGKMFRAELFHRFLHGSAWIATTEPMTNIADVVDYIDHEVTSKPKPSWVPVPSISASAPVGEMRVKP